MRKSILIMILLIAVPVIVYLSPAPKWISVATTWSSLIAILVFLNRKLNHARIDDDLMTNEESHGGKALDERYNGKKYSA